MSTATLNPEEFLPRFGLTGFRTGQREVIDAVLAGEDCLCVMPTGGGKSLCYQLPAVARQGITLVVSPLIALMKDQVDQLWARGLKATFINSTLTGAEQLERLEGMTAGQYDLVYVVPERFRSPRFVEAVRNSNLQLLAVDEAHCISQWGHDFRPDYARLGRFRGMLGNPTTIALTATATDAVRRDIVQQLNLRAPRIFITGFARPNLNYEVQSPHTSKRKDEALEAFLKTHPGSGIIYASSRKRCEQLAEQITASIGRHAAVYHAGMAPEDRRKAQDRFMQGRCEIVVATTAFGMGIDKADVRFVVHYNLPGTLEGYYQEAGRAGRDGLPSQCLLLYSYGDLRIQEFFIESAYPAREVVASVYEHLRRLEQDPIELTQQELKERLGLQISAEGVGACEQLLEQAGVLERLEPRENMALARLDSDLPTLVDLLPRQAKVQRRVLQALEQIIGPRRFERVYFNPRELLAATELDATALSRTLRELRQLKALEYFPPFRGRAIHMLERDKPFGELEIDFEALEERKAIEYEKLNRVVSFAQSSGCREQEILDYFGQAESVPCGRCDNCLRRQKPAGRESPEPAAPGGARVAPAVNPNLLEAIRKALSGVARARGRFGRQIVAQMLCGSSAAKVLRFGLQRLSTYGLMKDWKQEEVSDLLDALLGAGCLEQQGQDRPTIQLTELGHEAMAGRVAADLLLSLSPELARRFPTRAARPPREKTLERVSPPAGGPPINAAPAAAPPAAPDLALPTSQAPTRNTPSSAPETAPLDSQLPPFAPAPNATSAGPNHAELAEAPAGGDATAADAETPPASGDLPPVAAPRPAHYWTWRLLASGFSVDDCTAIRGLDREVVLDHALRSIEADLPVDVHWFLAPAVVAVLNKVIGPGDPARIRPLLAKLPPGIRYEEVQLFLKCRGQAAGAPSPAT